VLSQDTFGLPVTEHVRAPQLGGLEMPEA